MTISGQRSETTLNAVWRLLVRLTLIAVIGYACYRLRNIFTTIFIAAIVAYVLDWPVEWMCRQPLFVRFHCAIAGFSTRLQTTYRRVIQHRETNAPARVQIKRHTLRVYASLYAFVIAVVLLWFGAKTIVTPFVQEFRAATSPVKVREYRLKVEEQLGHWDATAPDWAKSNKARDALRKTDLGKMAEMAVTEAGKRVLESAKNIVEVVVLPVLAFYFLVDGRKLKHEFISLVPRPRLREAMLMTREFNSIMRSFVVGQVILCLLAGVVIGLFLYLLGVPYALTLGLLAGITRAIPIVGPIIGGIPIILLTWATAGTGPALIVLGFFTFMHLAESKFVMPLLIGDRMELHPVVIIVVLIAGGEIGGLLIGGTIGSLLGMFFAAPVAAIARVMIRRYWLQLRKRETRPHPALPAIAPTAEPEALTAPARVRFSENTDV